MVVVMQIWYVSLLSTKDLNWSSICRWVLELDYEGSVVYTTAPRWITRTDDIKEATCVPGNVCKLFYFHKHSG